MYRLTFTHVKTGDIYYEWNSSEDRVAKLASLFDVPIAQS